MFSGLDENGLSIVEEAHRVHRVFESGLEENFALFVNMDHTFPPVCYHRQKDEGVIDGGMQVKDFSVLFG